MTIFFLVIFAAAASLAAWVTVGYPLAMRLVAILAPRPVRSGPVTPKVTLVIPAYNEERVIQEKVRNALEQDYPRDRLEIVVASDGSSDATVEIARQFEGEGVRVLDLERRGKAFALNDAAEAATGEILVFTDATVLLDPVAVARLVEPFADPEVGGVCGNQRYLRPGTREATAGGERAYWNYDKWVKAQESRAGSIFASDGSLHAVRRDLYVPLAEAAQADDIAISARVVMQGRRLVYEPRAVAWEEPPEGGRAEFHRKVRITNHSMSALLGLGRGLWANGMHSFSLLSHKFLRHLIPLYLLALLASSAVLAFDHPAFAVVVCLQVLFYLAAVSGWLLRKRAAGGRKVLLAPYFFTLANLAAFAGIVSLLRGEQIRTWRPRGGMEGDSVEGEA
jgi:cellulose synthase/poly-beta-1,6-N-acetylglucosamine synthase-like glycosyltransferase